MSVRLFKLSAVLVIGLLAPLALAQPSTDVPPAVENSNFTFEGVTNTTAYVRSGPAEAYYAIVKLSKGSPLVVVGHRRFGDEAWLKIVPPEGCFSYVAKQYVSRQGDVGTITADNVNVRAGSKISAVKSTVQCKLNTGDQVSIIGEQDEYYTIKPPATAYVYINQKLVDPVRKLAGPTTRPSDVASTTTRPAYIAVGPTSRPAEPKVDEIAVARAAAARQKAEADFEALETSLKAAMGKALADQPLPELLAGYEKLAKNEYLPASMLRIVEQRLPYLRARNEAREDYLATMKRQQELAAAAEAIANERKKLQAADKLEVYTAVGTLQASTFQPGGATLYRVTDPANGRTQCYVRSSDPKFPQLLGQFVGVRGELITDAQLSFKVVEATSASVIDPARVNNGITAKVIPPSLTKGAETANTGNN